MIDWLENWYKEQCDGNWEHDYGIKIETLDNPGWYIKIDLEFTNTHLSDVSWTLFEISENNWFGFEIKNNQFISSGDPKKLSFMIFIFKELCTKNTIDNLDIIEKMQQMSI